MQLLKNICCCSNRLIGKCHKINASILTSCYAFCFFVVEDIWYDETDSSRGYMSTKLNTMWRSLPQELQQRQRTGKYAGMVKAPKKEELKRTYQQLEVVTSEEEAELVHFCKRFLLHPLKQQ